MCVCWIGGDCHKVRGRLSQGVEGGTATVPVSLHQPTISPCVGSDKPRMKALSVGRVTLLTPPPASLSHKAKDARMMHAHTTARQRYEVDMPICTYCVLSRITQKENHTGSFHSSALRRVFLFYDCVKMSFKLLAPDKRTYQLLSASS